jgi:hypothetical protein
MLEVDKAAIMKNTQQEVQPMFNVHQISPHQYHHPAQLSLHRQQQLPTQHPPME